LLWPLARTRIGDGSFDIALSVEYRRCDRGAVRSQFLLAPTAARDDHTTRYYLRSDLGIPKNTQCIDRQAFPYSGRDLRFGAMNP